MAFFLRRAPLATRYTAVRPIQSRMAVLPNLGRSYATKQTQDKDSLDPVSTEHSKSGGDHAAVHDTNNTAFDPKQTRPEQEQANAEVESGEKSNPLNVSPANHDLSTPNKGSENSPADGPDRSHRESSDRSSDRARTSGKGSPQKSGGGQYGSGGQPPEP